MSLAKVLIANSLTSIQIAMRRCGVSQQDIVDESGVDKSTVSRTLNQYQCGQVKHSNVVKVRSALEKLLETDLDFSEYDGDFQ